MVYKNEGGLICKPRTRVVKETLAPEQSRMSFVDWLRLILGVVKTSVILGGINNINYR